MAEQFATFQALYEQSCQVVGTHCGQPFTIWRAYLPLLLLSFGLALYWWTGAARRVAEWTTGWTQRGWLRALLISAPPVAAWIIAQVAIAAWQSWNRAVPCAHILVARDGRHSCLGGSKSSVAMLFDVALESLWLWPVAALLTGVAMVLLRKMPRWWWVLPTLLWGSYLVVQEIRIPGHLVPLKNEQLLSVIGPMADREGLSRSKLLVSQSMMEDVFTVARVQGMGSNQTIMFGYLRAHGNPISLSVATRNGFRLPKLSDAAWRSVMGHELAHIRQDHALKALAFVLALIAILCWLTSWLCLHTLRPDAHTGDQPVVERWSRLALLSATLPILFIIVDAAGRSFWLALEFEADRIGLDISREPDGFAEFALLDAAGGRFELDWRERWITSHPSNADRIRESIDWQQRHRPSEPIAIPDTQRLLIPADHPYPAGR